MVIADWGQQRDSSMPWRSGSLRRLVSSCTRDALGRIASQTETLGGAAVEKAYAYDLRGRLVAVTTDGVVTEWYAYDLNGNRTNSMNGAALYDAQDRLLANSSAVFSYDANGSRISQLLTPNSSLPTTYSYDLFGQLSGVTLPDGRTVSYDRDALHRVTAKRVNGAVTQGWIYKDGLAPVAETDGGTNVVSFFVYGTSPFSPDYMVKDGTTYRLIRDFAGSIRLVVNADTGDIAQRLDYDSFGNVSQDTNPGFQPFGFKSGLYDSDTGLVHFGARWYDPATGRWISKDPILLAGGLNLYAFCGNDPVNGSDPSGLCEETWWDRFKNNYSDTMNDLYGDDLDWADTLGLWGLGALAMEAGLSSYQTMVEYLAAEQIANAPLAGVFGGGSMLQRMAMAVVAAENAGRTAVVLSGLHAVSATTSVVGAGATGYSIGARLNGAVQAAYRTFQEGH